MSDRESERVEGGVSVCENWCTVCMYVDHNLVRVDLSERARGAAEGIGPGASPPLVHLRSRCLASILRVERVLLRQHAFLFKFFCARSVLPSCSTY